jgi:hypothetical protein
VRPIGCEEHVDAGVALQPLEDRREDAEVHRRARVDEDAASAAQAPE